MFMRKSAEVFIYFSSSHMRLLVEVGALWIKCSKTSCFSKERRCAYCFSIEEIIIGNS